MSLNNILLLTGSGPFEAYDVSADGHYTFEGEPAFSAPTIQEAVHKAQEYCKEHFVEYGYRFLSIPPAVYA